MKRAAPWMVILACAWVGVADPGTPRDKNLLAHLNDLDVDPKNWELADGVLRSKAGRGNAQGLVMVKPKVVKVPVWYSLRCQLSRLEPDQHNRLPEAGLVFGHVDQKNHWVLRLGTSLNAPQLKLIHMQDGQPVFESSVPIEWGKAPEKISLAVKIHHGARIEIYMNRTHRFTHKLFKPIPVGGVGLTLVSGSCDFSNFKLDGIARR